MSQSQQKKQELHTQEQQTSTTGKNGKRKNKRKPSDGSGTAVNCEPKQPVGPADESKLIERKKPLHASMEHLQMAQKLTITPTASRKSAGSNWEAVAKVNQQNTQITLEQENVADKNENSPALALSKSARNRLKRRAAEEKYVAMDCEMVGVGINGQDDMLARVSIVNKRGEVLLDKFVKPQESVTDYRTSVSGIRPHDIINGEDFKSVQDEVVQMLQGKVLIGHAIRNDLAVLHIKHPQSNIRDTSRYKPLSRLVANGRTPSLKRLSQAILNKEIQTGEHNSVEDARAAMSIYNVLAKDWEAYIKRHQQKHRK